MAEVAHVASADGTRIAYRTRGSGDPIVLVHGSATSGTDWIPAVRFLRDRFTTVVIDRRGRGESADGDDYAIEREAEDILAVLEDVDGELLVGHSYGAMCSILAAERTDRLRRLVLYEPPIGLREEAAAAVEEIVARGENEIALEAFLRGAGAGDREFESIRSSPAWPTLLGAIPALPRELHVAAAWRHPTGPIDVPTLFILGARNESPAYLDGLDELLAAFTDLRREPISGPNHTAHVFAAEEFADLVADFCGR